jgi:hypothetical protein
MRVRPVRSGVGVGGGVFGEGDELMAFRRSFAMSVS